MSDEKLGRTERLAACTSPGRTVANVEHTTRDLVRQRLFGIARGNAECNDVVRLSSVPIHHLLNGPGPESGATFA